MNHKIISGFFILIFGAVFLFLIFLSIYSITVRIGVSTERNYVDYFRGVWEPTPPLLMERDIKRIKEDNINIISLGPLIHIPSIPGFDSLYLGVIKQAKKEGIAIHITPQAFGPGPPNPDSLSDETLKIYSERILKWARFAEKYSVEYFSPLNEPDVVMETKKAIEWHSEILPKIKEVYSGKIIAKWSGCEGKEECYDMEKTLIKKIQASGDFDGVSFDLFPPENKEDLEEFFLDLKMWAESSAKEAKKLNLKIAIGEFAFPQNKPSLLKDIIPGFIVSEEEQAELTKKYLDIVMPYYDGVFYCGWTLPGYAMKGNLVEEIIKEKFAEY